MARIDSMTKETFDNFIQRLRNWNQGEGVDDHITADPIFIVEKKNRIYGLDPDYTDKFVYIIGDEEISDLDQYYKNCDKSEQRIIDGRSIFSTGLNFLECITIYDQEDVFENIYDDFRKVYYIEKWEYVSSHFTKEAAEAFIARKKHDYPLGLRVFVDAQVYCWEYRQIIRGLLDGEITFIEK